MGFGIRMEKTNNEKKPKAAGKKSAFSSLRLRKETKSRMLQELNRINRKEFGRKVRIDDLVAFMLTLVTSEHHVALQDASLSHKGRFDRDYKTYVAQHGPITKDEYLGKRLNGEIPIPYVPQPDTGGRA